MYGHATMLPATPEWHDWQVLDSEDLRTAPPTPILRTLGRSAASEAEKITASPTGESGPTRRPPAGLRQRCGRSSSWRPSLAISVGLAERSWRPLSTSSTTHSTLCRTTRRCCSPARPARARRCWPWRPRAGKVAVGRYRSVAVLQPPARSATQARHRRYRRAARTATFHQALLQTQGSATESVPRRPFWDEELPDLRGGGAARRSGLATADDFLIVDEIQDIARQPFLDVLDLLVKGGLRRTGGCCCSATSSGKRSSRLGRWPRRCSEARIPSLAALRLTVELPQPPAHRPPRRTTSAAWTPGYRRFRRQDDGVDPAFIPYTAGDDQSPTLARRRQHAARGRVRR